MGTLLPVEVLPTVTRHFTTHMQAKKSTANDNVFFAMCNVFVMSSLSPNEGKEEKAREACVHV